MMKKEEKIMLVAIDGYKTFKEWKAFKEQGLQLDIEILINKICEVVSSDTVHYSSPFGFRCAFIGLPEKVNPELREFLDLLQKAGVMVSTAPLLRGKEKEIDPRLQMWLENISANAAKADKVMLVSGDSDFCRVIKEIKNIRNVETICVFAKIREKDIFCSQNLKEACTDFVNLAELTEDKEIFKPAQQPACLGSSLMSRLLEQSKNSSPRQAGGLMKMLKQPSVPFPFQGRKTKLLSIEAVRNAIRDTIVYKEERCRKKLSWISLESLQKTLSLKGYEVESDALEKYLLRHQEVFFVSSYTTGAGETFKTVSLYENLEQSVVNFKSRLQQFEPAV